jgi:hypothetical protein
MPELTKTGKIYQMGIKYSKWPQNTYNNIFHCKTVQNLTKIGIFGLKIYHLATLENLPSGNPGPSSSWHFQDKS